MNKLHDEILNEISKVFNAKPKDTLFVKSAGQYFDVTLVSSELKCEHWNELPIQTLVNYRNILAYFNEDGFYFYLPAWLSAIIREPHKVDTLTESVVFFLTPHESDSDLHEAFLKRANKFSKAEASVIVKFFESYFDLFPINNWSHSNKHIQQISEALKFWSHKAGEA